MPTGGVMSPRARPKRQWVAGVSRWRMMIPQVDATQLTAIAGVGHPAAFPIYLDLSRARQAIWEWWKKCRALWAGARHSWVRRIGMAGRNRLVGQHLRRALSTASTHSRTDKELLEAFAVGEEWAFETLVQRHGPLVLSVCRRVLQNE